MGKKNMLSMRKLEKLFLKEISSFKALKNCEEGIHKFSLFLSGRLSCSNCGFEFRIPEDESSDYLKRVVQSSFWDDIIAQKRDGTDDFLINRLNPLLDDAFDLVNPRHEVKDLLKTTPKLMESPLMPLLEEFNKRYGSIEKIERKCRFGEHQLTFVDPQSPFVNKGNDDPEKSIDINRSKGIWCMDCGLLILSMSNERWNCFKNEEAIKRINSKKALIRDQLQEYFRALEEYNWITLKEKEKFQALINSYNSFEREELQKFLAKQVKEPLIISFSKVVDEKRQNDEKIERIREYERSYKNVLDKLMQEINSAEELENIRRLEHLKSQQSELGKHSTVLENLSYLFRLIQLIYKQVGSKIKENLSRPYVFFQASEDEKYHWHSEIKGNIEVIKGQKKELQQQKDAILYPDSQECHILFWT